MAVYTEVPDHDLRSFLDAYDLGAVIACKGIAEGVENSNFLLQTERGRFILTLYEKRVRREDLPFFLGLMRHLAARGIECPTPIAGRDGATLRELCSRPAAIISFLDGMWPRQPGIQHCRALGAALADLHRQGADFAPTRENDLSLAGWRRLAAATADRADAIAPGLRDLIAEEIAFLSRHWPADLPRGIIHADLFPDNVFFLGERLSGLIDFYFACRDFLAYDIAVCLNAWAFAADGRFEAAKAAAIVDSYQTRRPLAPAERAALGLLARGAALRFLLTRLYDWLHHPAGAFVQPKDPLEYLAKLHFFRARDAAEFGGA